MLDYAFLYGSRFHFLERKVATKNQKFGYGELWFDFDLMVC